MFRAAIVLLLCAAALSAAAARLYMKDGSYHSVREYQKLADRIRYFSSERGEWEEIPLELVDLKKTEAEVSARDAERKEDAKAQDLEEKAERAHKREIEAIPWEAGVFQIKAEKAIVLQNAEIKVADNKRRSILKAISPIPIFSGKSTVEVDGVEAAYKVPPGQPEFYLRMANDVRFEIIRVRAGKKNVRIVQDWDIIPVSKELIETTDVIETFKQQLADGLYKVWPIKPLEPGQYAVAEWVEGKGDIQVWDFTVAR
ncbi:MAG: hypothetical protein SGI92_11570 [Bryobacteraceae bacterium]|nr:hypothetical protein [Bryobacteraceae bacterium]